MKGCVVVFWLSCALIAWLTGHHFLATVLTIIAISVVRYRGD
jgi:hypothetical protein